MFRKMSILLFSLRKTFFRISYSEFQHSVEKISVFWSAIVFASYLYLLKIIPDCSFLLHFHPPRHITPKYLQLNYNNLISSAFRKITTLSVLIYQNTMLYRTSEINRDRGWNRVKKFLGKKYNEKSTFQNRNHSVPKTSKQTY